MTKFMVNDRVTRPRDIYDANSPLMHGRVVRVDEQVPGGLDGVTWLDPEVYGVEWDEEQDRERPNADCLSIPKDKTKKTKVGYLPHGLDPEPRAEPVDFSRFEHVSQHWMDNDYDGAENGDAMCPACACFWMERMPRMGGKPWPADKPFPVGYCNDVTNTRNKAGNLKHCHHWWNGERWEIRRAPHRAAPGRGIG